MSSPCGAGVGRGPAVRGGDARAAHQPGEGACRPEPEELAAVKAQVSPPRMLCICTAVYLSLLVCRPVRGGCAAAEPPPAPTPTATRAPELARAPKAAGEIVVTGDASPASHGPYEFKGAYTVRFEQYAPEDPKLDFSAQTAFVAALDREAEITGGDSIELFEEAHPGPHECVADKTPTGDAKPFRPGRDNADASRI